jgi:hypothetical protein
MMVTHAQQVYSRQNLSNLFLDTCDAVKGCVHTAITCDDSDLCTEDSCNPKSGCNFTAVVLPPSNKCTAVWCHPTLGISSTPTKCPAACGGCDPATGCSDCPQSTPITTAQAAGIGAGAIAGIVIGAIAGLAALSYASKKGYDKLTKAKVVQTSVNENPMYEKSNTSVENAMFEENK